MEHLNLKALSTSKLAKKLIFMLVDGQTSNPLYLPYLEELKERLGVNSSSVSST